MGAPRVKADAGHPALILPYRELHLVAVTVHLRRGQDIQYRHLQPTNAAEGIRYAFLFGAQLGGIVQMPQAASAARPRYRAVHRDAVRGGGKQLVQDAKGITTAVLDDAYLGFIARGGAGYEYGFAIGTVGNAAAIAGKALDAQGQDLIFL